MGLLPLLSGHSVSSTLSFLVPPFVLIRLWLPSVWLILLGRENIAKLHILHFTQNKMPLPPSGSRAFIHKGAYPGNPTKPSACTAQCFLLWSQLNLSERLWASGQVQTQTAQYIISSEHHGTASLIPSSLYSLTKQSKAEQTTSISLSSLSRYMCVCWVTCCGSLSANPSGFLPTSRKEAVAGGQKRKGRSN